MYIYEHKSAYIMSLWTRTSSIGLEVKENFYSFGR